MSADFHYLKTLESYLDKPCKVVYRDGRKNSPAKAFYGKLLAFDIKFQMWEGDDKREGERKFQVNFNHEDVSRIVFGMGDTVA